LYKIDVLFKRMLLLSNSHMQLRISNVWDELKIEERCEMKNPQST